MSRHKTKGEDKKTPDTEVPVLDVSQALFACVHQAKITDLQFIGEPKGLLVRFIAKACIMTGIMDNEKTEIPTLAEIFSEQSTNTEGRSALVSIRTPNTRFNIDSDGVLGLFFF